MKSRFLAAILPLLVACNPAKCSPQENQEATRPANILQIALKFEAVVGDQAFACGKSYDGIGLTKSRITPSDFRFYVSGVELLDQNGKVIPVTLDQDGIWQYKDVALMDFEDGNGPCRNGNPGMHREITGTVPQGHYRGIRFMLGVPFDLNHDNPTIAPSPLNFTSMFWVWQAGYKFVKIDMATSGLPQEAHPVAPVNRKAPRAAGFSVHLGSTACASPSLTTPPTACKNPNRVTVAFDDFDVGKNIVVADVASLLREADVDRNAPDTAPGCMSGPEDSDCAPVMAAFGLPFNDQTATPQRFFRMR
ncbi:MAG: metallo-mystery pair system four-Cys motif protein [Burkholderiales bacterium]|nr:metallo-mystery pair system four-Cys motif protein [Burkholderiales bacterium]